MAREQLQNNTSDTLSAGCTSGDTTISVTTGSSFPATGNFRILVDSEIMLVTARSSNTLTVTRGAEGTSAASHSGGATVTMILTAGAMQAYGRDSVPGFAGSRPPFRLLDASGNVLTTADFTAIGGSATISDVDGAILLRKPSVSGQDFALLARTQPTPPADLIVAMRCCWPCGVGSARVMGAIGLRESATGKLLLCSLERTTSGGLGFSVFAYSNPTTEGATRLNPQVSLALMPELWLKLSDDGTNVAFSVSDDGQDWIQLYSEGRADDFTTAPDQWVWGLSANSSSFNCTSRLVHWSEA